jgi:hypothetical protein
LANRRKNISTRGPRNSVSKRRLIVTEGLPIKNMTAAAKGTAENPRNNVERRPD